MGIVIISSIKTGEGKAARIVVDQEAFASVVSAQEDISANITAAEDTATDIKMGRQEVQTSNLNSAFALQNLGIRSARNLDVQWRSRSVR